MAQNALKILIADDDAGDRKHVTRALKQTGLAFECTETVSIDEALEACAKSTFDCAIVDYRMPGHDGLQGITALHERLPYMSIIMATSQGDEMVAAEAIKRGAADYVPKIHIRGESIRRIIENGMEKTNLRRKVAQQQEELEIFARVLVHDLKEPTSSIQTLADFIVEHVRQGRLEKLVDYCGHISKAARRMDMLIDAMRAYTTADARIAFEPQDMNLALEDVLSSLDHQIRERGACVTHGELPIVTGNAPQLIQLLQNLIGNSIKYCVAKNPCIHVAAEAQDKSAWLFSVKDNGIGIPEQYRNSLFEPFTRLHGAGKYDGTGLGLATCKKIVERHNGGIWCDSGAGLGATFFFTLQGVDSTRDSATPHTLQPQEAVRKCPTGQGY